MGEVNNRFWQYVDKTDTCWLWKGYTNPRGYGVYSFGYKAAHRTVRVHRYAYEQLVGPIPNGLELDHLCRTRVCVNPRHLEPVLHTENLRRGAKPWSNSWQWRQVRKAQVASYGSS